MKKIALIILLSFVILTSKGQEKLTLTIDKAVEIGLQNSKALRTSQFKVVAAEAKSSETNALGLPSLKFNGNYTRLSEVPDAVVDLSKLGIPVPPVKFGDNIVNSYGLKATVQQPLFTGWKLSGAQDAAEYSAEATKEDFNKDKSDVIYNIKAAYWNVYRAIEFKKVVDENVEQIKSHATDADNLMKQGLITTNDVLKVQVQLSDALVRQIDAKNNVKLSMYALNNSLGLPLTTEIELASKIEVQDRQWDAVEQLVKNAFEKRPEMLAMNARVKASEAGVTAAKGGWWPQVYLVGNYNYLRPNTRIFPTKDEFKDTWDVTLSLSFDIWNWNQTGNQTTQAEAQLSQSEEYLSMLEDGVTLEVTQSYLAVNQAKERKAVAEQGVVQAEENHRVMSEKYKKGLIPNLDLKDAENGLLQAKLNLTQSLVDYELSMARLSKAIGE